MTTFSSLGLNLVQASLTCSLGNLLNMTVIQSFNSAMVLQADLLVTLSTTPYK